MAIKVLQLGKYYPPNWGGIETVTYNLNQVLSSKDIEVTTFVYGDPREKEIDKSISRFDYIHFHRTPISFSMLLNVIKQANKYDYIILHVPNPWSILSLLLSRYRGKVILYWHAESKGNPILERIVDFVQSKLLKRVDYIFGATSEHYKNMPGYDSISERCRKYSYPISQRLYEVSLNQREKSFDFSEGVRLLNVGRLVDYKGQCYLIDAVRKLVSKGYDVHLTLIGSGPLYSELSSLIKKYDLEERIKIRQNLPIEELELELQSSHIFCFPSISEQEMYGMAQIEAYAYGLPVIASNIERSGVGEVAASSGAALITEPKNSDDLVEKIATLINSKSKLKEMSSSAKDFIRGFSYDRKRKEFLSILDLN
ncbi:putative glycosyltransferase [Vibrio nigripulchritudo ATCC 27043]|uniref:glycosyltransferase n=1 Tax=Vibrio nigripulchritudo TaxID=28173 RepID=UPI00021C1898|nr:glycosyltransferase [Vibrio nigripulchritudo]EGU56686.1 putative glycosyltransferase [Vibrio nigripulchritudo ATCC 27043]